MNMNRFRFIWCFLLMGVLTGGCIGLGSYANPLAGWQFLSMSQVPKVLTDDVGDFLRSLPDQKGHDSGATIFFQDGTGQIGVSIGMYLTRKTVRWYYAIIYSKDYKRLKVIKYGYTWYMS